jgi:hypothetical protein
MKLSTLFYTVLSVSSLTSACLRITGWYETQANTSPPYAGQTYIGKGKRAGAIEADDNKVTTCSTDKGWHMDSNCHIAVNCISGFSLSLWYDTAWYSNPTTAYTLQLAVKRPPKCPSGGEGYSMCDTFLYDENAGNSWFPGVSSSWRYL